MATAIERLKAFARAAAAPLTAMERRILAETGLPVVFEAAADPVHAAVLESLLALSLNGDHAGLTTAFDDMFQNKAFTGTGYRTYRIAHELMLATDETGAAAHLSLSADRWCRDRTDPIAASIYANALLGQSAAQASTAGGLNGDSAAPGRDALRVTCGEARRVLAFAGPGGRRHWLWRQADLMLTIAAWTVGVEDEDMLLPAFAAVQTLDPHEFGVYDDRTMQLLLGWPDTAGSVDRFATAAADRTAARFGDLMYARIYDLVLAEDDLGAALVDPQRFLAGFSDWYQRFPGQPLANRFAAHAHAFGDLVTLERLFRGPLREVHPNHWFDRDQPLDAWRSISRNRRAAAN